MNTSRRLFLQSTAVAGIVAGTGAASLLRAPSALALTSAETKRLQNNLHGLGYYKGPINGASSADLTDAVRRFQADSRLAADGVPGMITQAVIAARVSLVQYKVGAGRDSSFGPRTASLVANFQASHGLRNDGIAGSATFAAMDLTRVVGLGTSSIGGQIRRTEIIQRAAYWPTLGISYSQSKYHRDINNSKTYRTDCSGLASNGFHASQSYATSTMHQCTTQISKDALLPGDVLNKPNYHVAVFAGWTDSSKTSYFSLEESSSSHRALARVVTSYPYYGKSGFVPRRYNKVVMG